MMNIEYHIYITYMMNIECEQNTPIYICLYGKLIPKN